MKRIIKRVFATVCVIFILSSLVIPCFGATPSRTYNITFNFDTFNDWTTEQNNAISDLWIRDCEGRYYFDLDFNGQTLTLNYIEGSTSIFTIINNSDYEIRISYGQANPWKWLGELVVPPKQDIDNPGQFVVTPGMLSGTVGTIKFYSYSSLPPTYIAPTLPSSSLIQYYYSDGTSAPWYEVIDESFSYGWYDVPLIHGYNVIPSRIYIHDINDLAIFPVYLFTYDEYNRYFEGYDSGQADAYKDIFAIKEEQYNLGYSAGLNDGLKQNKLTYSQMQEIRSEYNVFTAFFDGIFSGLLNLWNTVTNGISFGGVTVNTVISSMLVIFVVVLIGSAILKL